MWYSCKTGLLVSFQDSVGLCQSALASLHGADRVSTVQLGIWGDAVTNDVHEFPEVLLEMIWIARHGISGTVRFPGLGSGLQ